MSDLKDKTRLGCISIYHQCIPKELADDAVQLFKKYRELGADRDGVTGGGMNKAIKDSRDMNPHSQFNVGHEFREVADEIEKHVMECLIDYYKDNPNMLFGAARGFSLASYNKLPDVEEILPKVVRLQHGQFQYYHPKNSEVKGGGYPANHCETYIHKDKQAESDTRTLTWMMTLNDLPETKDQSGYTVFTGQKIAVRPKAGQLVLFSPWLDCEHRGNRVSDVEKIIVTSWVNSDI